MAYIHTKSVALSGADVADGNDVLTNFSTILFDTYITSIG